jgi:hypothetical protein
MKNVSGFKRLDVYRIDVYIPRYKSGFVCLDVFRL